MLNGLDLFSGIGGISEALSPWVRTVAYCENERCAQRILLSRMYRGEIHQAPIWDDVRNLTGPSVPPIDIISAGFPCQDISLAGLRAGLAGERSGLFFHVVRLAKETGAPIVFLENVYPGVNKYIPTIRNAFVELGYEFRDGFISAQDVGAPHLRRRWFAVATNTDSIASWLSERWGERSQGSEALQPRKSLETWLLANTDGEGLQGHRSDVQLEQTQPFSTDLLEGDNWDEYASFFLRVDNGLPDRGNRLRALGNGVVPQQARKAFEILTGLKYEKTTPKLT